jgi:branched-subunit amino acid transport protein
MSNTDLVVVIGMALAVYLPKVLPLVIVSEHLTDRFSVLLRYVAPAILGALVAPNLVAQSLNWNQIGYLVAFIVVLRTRHMLASVGAGMLAVFIATFAANG